MAKVLNIDEAIALHKGNAEFYKETGEEIMMQNELNLANWLTEAKEWRNWMMKAVMECPPYQNPIVFPAKEVSEIDYNKFLHLWNNPSNVVVALMNTEEGGLDENGNKEIRR